MGLSDEERQIMIRHEYAKAITFYEQALKNAEIGIWDVVANRMYYSLFHVVSALLIRDHHKIGTHKGAVMMFGLHYVNTGVFSIQEGRLYSQLQTLREKADYNCSWSATEQDIEPILPLAKTFLEKTKEILKEEL